jgi:hypothetical protein
VSDIFDEEVDQLADKEERLVDQQHVSIPVEWSRRPEQPQDDRPMLHAQDMARLVLRRGRTNSVP